MYGVVSANICDLCDSAITEFDVLSVRFEVFFKSLLDFWLLDSLFASNVFNVVEDHVDLTNGRVLNEILDNFCLHLC